MKLIRASLLTLMLCISACTRVEDPSLFPAYDPANAAPIPEKDETRLNPQRNLYWGDLHIHTGLSTGAWVQGVRTRPDDAYTYARGGEIEHAAGYGIKPRRPLDFAAVTDHAEYLGFLIDSNADHPLNERSLRDHLLNNGRLANTWMIFRSLQRRHLDAYDLTGWEAYTSSAWQETIDAANAHNIPGRFTAFVAYEWTSMPDDQNLHRNVIYRSDDAPEMPFSANDSEDPRDLWTALEKERAEGKDNLVIPHNGNLSDGRMYDAVMYDGGKLDKDYAERRMRNEPVSEIYQIKGSSEAHPSLSPGDEFAGFEIYEAKLSSEGGTSQAKGSYMRDALRLGLELGHSDGFNPYRFGAIGGTDGHNSSSPTEEDNYHGKLPLLDGSAGIRLRTATFMPEEMQGGPGWSSGGIAAIWARENTREELFDAMRRRETYATSGPRIAVRFFGGWGYTEDLLAQADWIDTAEFSGVPMGGELSGDAQHGAPTFALWAMRDPHSANLDRIQVIKGWVGADGRSREKVYNVAWSGERQPDASGALAAVGNTVDVAEASYTNTIGSEQLATVWTDPDFDPAVAAFYYARVIEIPTPRWSTYDAKTLGIEAPEPASLQERAVTSAIWYQPAY